MISDIAGWTGLPEGPAGGRASLAAMLRPRPSADGSAPPGTVHARVAPLHALGQRRAGVHRPVPESEEHTPWCAIDGHPRWTERRLADLAESDGDAAALADGFVRHNVEVVRHIAGRFRLAVVGPRRALLAVDRVASLPMYVASPFDGVLVFASSLDGLRAHPLVLHSLSAQAILEYFHFQVLHGGRTIYHGIERLPPAHLLVFDGDGIEQRRYWHASYVPPRRCSAGQERELHEEVRRVLRESVHREVERARGEVGAFLSGGLDSSTVLGMMTEDVGHAVDSFTVRFDVPGYDESPYAAIAARRFGARERVYTITPDDMVGDLERIACMFDEPFGNSSAAGAYHCAELARRAGVGTLLSGDGGDELFAGGEVYVLMQRFEMFQRVPASLRVMTERVLERLPGAAAVPQLRRARSYVRRARIPMPARIHSYEYLSPATCSEVFAPEFLSAVDPAGPVAVMERTYAMADGGDTLQRHLDYARHTVLADNDLPKVRRTCEWHGVDARFPLLDDNVVSFVASVPSNVLVKHLHERAFYRDALRSFLPSAIIEKRKHCFSHPLGPWLSGPTPLRSAVVVALESFGRRGIVRTDLLDRLIAEPSLASRPDLTPLVWYMAVLERWLATRGLENWS